MVWVRWRGIGTYWQSMRSVMPPWPGMLWPKSLISKARLKPEAKKPPKGATRDAKHARTRMCSWYGTYGIVVTSLPSFKGCCLST